MDSRSTQSSTSDSDRWSLKLDATAGQLPDLSPLNPIVPTTAIAAFLPTGVDSNTTYDLGGFTLVYNRAQGYVESGTFLLDSHFNWPGSADY